MAVPAAFPAPVLPPLAERPRASLTVIAYGQEAYVRETIAAAFAQTYAPLEIVLSDDCSPDGTYRIMQEMAAAYDGPHAVILNRNPTNLGIVRNAERAMALAGGDLIVENSGDDISVPHRVARLVEVWLASGRRAKAIHSARRRMDPEGGLHEVMEDARVLAGMTPLEVIRDHGTLVGATLAWSREVFDVFGPVSPVALLHDFPIAFRAALMGDIVYVPEPLVHYRVGGISSRHETDYGYNHLYGFRIKSYRWHRSFWQRYLVDMAVVPPPDAAECRRLCEAKIARADFHIALAESAYWRLPLALPRSLALTLRQRDPAYLQDNLRYLLGPLYVRRLDAKRQRRQAQTSA